jgi:hypothetical protein
MFPEPRAFLHVTAGRLAFVFAAGMTARGCERSGGLRRSPLAFHQTQTVFTNQECEEQINNPQVRMPRQSVEVSCVSGLPKNYLQRTTTEQAHQRADRPCN